MIGVLVQPLDNALRQRLNLGDAKGVVVADVVPNSPAAKAGINSTDVIVAVDGQSVERQDQVSDLIAKKKAGDKVTLKVWRDGKTTDKTVTVEERAPNAPLGGFPRGFGN